jgi:hypothetical protein
MASTYSSLKIELIATGEQSGTWGNTTNVNLGTAIEEAITGSADVPFSSADVTLTLTNTNAAQTARNLRLNLTGTSGGARNLTVPDIEKFYIVANGLADDVTVQNTTGTTYTIPAGTTGQVFSTGTGIKSTLSFYEGALLTNAAVILGGAINATPIGAISASTGAFTTLNASGAVTLSGTVTLSTALPVAQGGTGATTFTSGALLKGNTTGAIQTASAADIVSQIGATAVTNATNSTNATTATNLANVGGWSVTPSGTNLYFNYNGTNVGVLTSTGDFTVLGNVTAYGTI